MAETKERNGIWQAEFWANGKRIRKSTSIAVGTTRAELSTSKQLAQQVADNMERVANGQTSYAQAADALRAVAQATGMITKMPTVREFLTDFQGQASPKTESNRRRAFKSFRHSVVTALRTNAAITADIARAIVGHDSEEIERQYCTASRADKMRGLDSIAQAITEPVESSMPLYPARTA